MGPGLDPRRKSDGNRRGLRASFAGRARGTGFAFLVRGMRWRESGCVSDWGLRLAWLAGVPEEVSKYRVTAEQG